MAANLRLLCVLIVLAAVCWEANSKNTEKWRFASAWPPCTSSDKSLASSPSRLSCSGSSPVYFPGVATVGLAYRRVTGTYKNLFFRYAVLITGCDSGFGHHLAQRLDAAGLVVFAGCLFPAGPGAQSLAKSCSTHLKVLPLDVTSDDQVQRAKEALRDNLPENGLWAVVNNAGIADWAETEWNTIKDYSHMVDVNLFGCIRTSIAFLPMVRATKGRMVYVSSILAFYTCLYMGAYSVSKRGLEAFADCLRVEMDSFGVKVCIVQPGNFGNATNIIRMKTGQDMWEKLDDERKHTFSRRYVDRVTESAVGKSGSTNVDAVVDAMVDAILSRRPKSRYLVASSVTDALFLHVCPYLPTRLADAIISRSPMYVERKAMLYSN